MIKTHSLLASMVSVVFAVVAVSPAFALNARAEEAQRNRETALERVETKKAEISTKLDAKKLLLCEKKQPLIQSRISKISSQGAKQLEVFNKIAERVQEFKITKNYSVDNYDAIVRTLNEKRLATQNAVSLALNSGQEFTCSADDPRGLADSFKEQVRLQISTLKEYKGAIKDLIIAVKSSNSAQNDAAGEES